MSNNSKIFDPLTGTYLDNSGGGGDKTNKPKTFDPLTGEGIENEPIFGSKPLNKQTEVVGQAITQREASSFPSLNPFRSDEEEIERRAEQQSTSDKIFNGVAKAGITFFGAALDNTAGLYAGTLSLLSGGSFVNNPLGQWIDELNENAQEQFPNYYTQEEQESINPFSANFIFDKVLNGAAYSAASVASMLVPGAGVSALTRNISKSMVKRAANEFGKQSITNARNLNNAVNYASRAFKSTIAESGVEARQTKNEIRDKITQQVIDRKRQAAIDSGNFTINPETGLVDVELTQDDYNEIEQISDAAMNANFWTNVGIVGASNIAMFGNILRNGSSQAFKDLRKRIIQEGGVYKLAEKNKLNTAKLIGKDAGSEAAQEGGQFISNITVQDVAQDFYESKYNSDSNTDILGSLLDATKETFSTKDGLESILIGGIVGGGMTSLRNVTSNLKNKINEQANKKGNQDKKTKEEALVDILNSESFVKMTEDMKDNARVQHYMDLANQAVVNNDEAAYHAATFNAFKSNLYSHLKNGTEDIFIEKLEEVKQMDDAEFKKFFGYGEMAQELDKNEIIDNYIEQTKKVTDIYKNMDFLYGYQNNYNVLDLIANKLNKDENEIRDYYKDELFDRVTQHEYLTDRTSQLETEIDELSEGLVTPKFNRQASDTPITKTAEQTKEFLENQKITQKELREKLKKDKKLVQQIKGLLDRSKTRFKTFDDVYNVLFSPKSKFTARQTEVIEALEKIAASEISPVKKAELIKKVNELSQLAFNAEVNNALLGKLEKLDNPKNTKEFENEVKATLESIDKRFKERLKEKAEAIKQEQNAKKRKEKKEQVKNQSEATKEEDKKDINQKLEEIEKEVADKAPTINEVEDNETDKLNALSAYLKDYFTNYPDLIQRELDNINSIYEANGNDTRFEDNEMILQEVVGDLYTLGPDSKIVQDLYNYYKERGSQKQAIQKPSTIEVKQAEPNLDAKSDINESIPKESQEGKGYNVKDNESKLITDTLEAREESVAIMKSRGITNAELPDVYDKVVATLNDPESIPEGSKIFIDYKINEYNKKATRPQLFAYVEDENGNRIDIGLIGGTQNDFTNSIYEQVKDKKGQSRIDLGLEVKRKAAGKFRNTDTFVSPLEIQSTPIFGIAQLTKQGMVLNTNGVEVNVRYNNLEEGHTYLLVPTPQKDKDGNTIHYPAKMTTRRLGDVSQDKVDEVMDLLLKSKKNKDESINNRDKVNDIIFLDYDFVNNQTIEIYDYSSKPDKEKRKTLYYDINNP
ncbi:MAG TPA: hypothetical protein VK982_13250, partial [Bacteroidales bacterium]|nr:hypothetical protein [Bacteroidales bacterium]